MQPILVRVGPIVIRYYGLMYVIAILTGFFLVYSELKRKRIAIGKGTEGGYMSADGLIDLLLWGIPAAIIGARAYYVAFQWGHYCDHPWDILKVWEGGLAIHGGLIGGGIAVYLFCRVKNVPFWKLADVLVPSLILGQAIGRIGNFMNGDAYGLPTTLPWGIHFPASSPAGRAYPSLATHPTMLYEAILNVAIFFYLWGIRDKGYRDGFSTSMYFILYSLARSLVSISRGDSLWLGPIRAAHVVSALLIIGFVLLILRRRLYLRIST
ncbi:MAG: prolipoprotein diacylglyceryl transferase [Candidatus Bipolaricaulota bacterium]|nr:prolipoprotein diacylglyceryl transferase [Candidatus Bipolaricaulota bacterium]